ncbi:hypothetical protein JYT59_00410 [Sphingobacteriaceae bacterium AH-315-L07]|nr:hypothetical protein [Sphingobacteriaceae bacterium AH-315-L07]
MKQGNKNKTNNAIIIGTKKLIQGSWKIRRECIFIDCLNPFWASLDQFHCSRACQNTANNLKKRKERDVTKDINWILLNNRRIYAYYFRMFENKWIEYNTLINDGLNKNFYTHRITNKSSGNTHNACYEFVIIEKEDKILIRDHGYNKKLGIRRLFRK